MAQTKTMSVVETLTNFIGGIIISVVSYWFLLPLFGINVPLVANLFLTGYFALISIVRTYLVRRAFNRQDKTNADL